MDWKGKIAAVVAMAALGAPALRAQSVPGALQGRWRVERVVARAKNTCWDQDRAQQLVGTTLGYGSRSLRWQGGEVPLEDEVAVVRTLTPDGFAQENGLPLPKLGVRLPEDKGSIREVDLQHEDADVTGGSTEVPGDTVLLTGPGRMVFRACGVYYSAVRVR